MKKTLLKGIILAVIVITLCGTSALCADVPYNIEYDYSKTTVKISGEGLTEEDFIVIQVLKSGKTSESFTDSDVLYRKQYTVKDGKYTFTMNYGDETGLCEAYVSAASQAGVTNFQLILASDTVFEELYQTLNAAAQSNDFETFKNCMNEKIKYFSADANAVGNYGTELKLYFEYVKNNPLTVGESTKNVSVLNTFLLAEKINNSELKNINNHIAALSFMEEPLLGYYTKLADSQAIQEHFTKKISGKNITNLEEFETTFQQALILTAARYSSGAGELKKIVETYAGAAGISTAASESVYKKLLGNDYPDAAAFKGAFENAVKTVPGTGTSSGGRGGSATHSQMSGNTFEMENATSGTGPQIKDITFNDIDGVPWASEAILALADKQIISGRENGYFYPDAEVTREEFVKMLVGAMGLSESGYSNSFTDVADTDWFCKYVNIARINNIANGIGDGKFGARTSITRQDMAVMLYNALKLRNAAITMSDFQFDDSDKIDDYAKESVSALYGMGVINGVSDTEFDPQGNATRAQTAKVIYAVLKELQ